MPIMQTVIQGSGGSAPAHYIECTVVNGVLSKGSSNPVDLHGVTSLPSYAFAYEFRYSDKTVVGFTNSHLLKNVDNKNVFDFTFENNTNLTTLGLTGVETVTGMYAFEKTCIDCTNLTDTSLTGLKTIAGYQCFSYTFYNCRSLTDTGLTNLETIMGERACFGTFGNCSSLQNIRLEKLKLISGLAAVDSMFSGCTNIQTATLPKLKTVKGSSAMMEMFKNCSRLQSVYFPAFNASESETSTFGSSGSGSFLSGVTGCTVHFHKSQQAIIGSWTSIVGGLGGTNTTVLFDLGVTATVSVQSGYTVYANGVDITNESTFDFFDGDNDIVSVSPDGKVGKYNFVATSSTTAFVFDPTQNVYNEFTITSNVSGATYLAQAQYEDIIINITPDSNNKIYVSSGFEITVNGSATGYIADPVSLSSDTATTITLTFVVGSSVVYDSSNILSALTGDTTYASVDSVNDLFLYHYDQTTNWAGSVQLQLTVPAGTTKIKIMTSAYVSSENNYDYGFISLGTQRVAPTYSQIKNNQISNGVYLFRQTGTANIMTPVTYETTDTTQNMLNLGWGQDGSIAGTNTLYVQPITVFYYQ